MSMHVCLVLVVWSKWLKIYFRYIMRHDDILDSSWDMMIYFRYIMRHDDIFPDIYHETWYILDTKWEMMIYLKYIMRHDIFYIHHDYMRQDDIY